LGLLTKSNPCTTLGPVLLPKENIQFSKFGKGDAELLMLGKTQAAMTQPNLSNGESVRCIKKLDMYNTTDQRRLEA
jgi:hypothetical protein